MKKKSGSANAEPPPWHRRFHAKDKAKDQRYETQRDRDRILYCSAFRRLAGVTQVVGAEQGHLFHNRLTHSLKVAQIARRIAEKVLRDRPELTVDPRNPQPGTVDPEVAEAAALAHDLGHPPFGHIAEAELHRLLSHEYKHGGFEGNAQSFRVVARIAVRVTGVPGLNLTRATINGILKYPWLRKPTVNDKKRKWGAYNSEEKEFDWARELFPGRINRTPEAEILDWADDITYAVHDVEDFYRAGIIPLDKLLFDKDELKKFLEMHQENIVTEHARSPYTKHVPTPGIPELTEIIMALAQYADKSELRSRYRGKRDQRAALRSLTATWVGRYVQNTIASGTWGKTDTLLKLDAGLVDEVIVLKKLTQAFVFKNPALAAQQEGQKHIIRELFGYFHDAVMQYMGDGRPKEKDKDEEKDHANPAILPVGFADFLAEEIKWATENEHDLNDIKSRVVGDLIAALTEQQAIEMHQRLTGRNSRSVLNPIVL